MTGASPMRAAAPMLLACVAWLVGVGRLECWVSTARADESEPAAARPMMRQLPPAAVGQSPPRDLMAARSELRRRFREPLSHTETAAGANAAAAALVAAATTEEDRPLKWLMLSEARRLAAAAGNAAEVDRAFVLAAACYDFDALAEEYRTLVGIPLRGLDPTRAASLATVAEKLSTRAEADGRLDLATSAQTLAVRGWERAGDGGSARRAATRLHELEPDRIPGRR